MSEAPTDILAGGDFKEEEVKKWLLIKTRNRN
jgi:hypothetical protein